MDFNSMNEGGEGNWTVGELLCPANIHLLHGLKERALRDPMWIIMKWAVRECHLDVELTRGTIPQQGPLLIVVNDPSALCGFIAHSLMGRDDAYYIGSPGWMKLGGSIAARGLPVFNIGDPRKKLKEWIRAQVLFRLRDGLDPATARQRNNQSLARASELITGGAAVVIAPAGGTIGKTDDWKHGVGRIVSQIGEVPARVVMMRIHNSTPRDAARMLLNPRWFPGLRKPRHITVEISEPMPVSDFRTAKSNWLQISLQLRDRYVKLFGTV